jgi:hypothetical protein
MAAQPAAPRAVLSSTELVSYSQYVPGFFQHCFGIADYVLANVAQATTAV